MESDTRFSIPKKARKGIGRKLKTDVRGETNVLPPRSQMLPPDEQVENVGTSNMEMEWSEATSIRIYDDPSLQGEGSHQRYQNARRSRRAYLWRI